MNYLRKTKSLLLVCISISAFGMLGAHAEQQKGPRFVTEKLSDAIYVVRAGEGYYDGNIAFLIGEDGVAMIDNGVEGASDALQEAVASITDLPIDYIINTHIHGDHTGNNSVFGALGTELVSHENLKNSLVEKGVKKNDKYEPAPKTAIPSITFSDQMTLDVNSEPAKLVHLPDAHTDGDTIVVFPKSNIIHAGDLLFNGLFPYVDAGNGGNYDGYIRAMNAIIEMSNPETVIIAGHGPVANQSDLERTVAMMIDAKNLVAKALENEGSEEEVLKANPLAKYHDDYNWGFITTEKMTKQVLHALSAN